MGLWVFILLSLLAVGESQPMNQINQTELQAAIASMRGSSYHGFVILLKMLAGTPNSLQTRDVTFLMPNDQEISEAGLTGDHFRDFILSHSIPTALVLNNLLHFPTGTLIPSSLPNRMINVTNNGRSGMYLNNAKIVNPNICLSSSIMCHGISTAMKFDAFCTVSSTSTPPANLRTIDSRNRVKKSKSSSWFNQRSVSPIH